MTVVDRDVASECSKQNRVERRSYVMVDGRWSMVDGRREPGGLPTLHFALCILPFAFMIAGHGEHV
jgi:hypothetical protein